ncbi:MAG: WecB/TagA/CpsF family glycosyltransferase [Opitutaceae bacterium]|nr:WecB/TagA/CpsF family glycosyltransferase [Cytophagales bacterium]
MENNRKTLEVLNYVVYTDLLGKINLKEKTVINTINQYSYCIAEEDPEFKKALKASDILLPDGVGITLSALLKNKKKIAKIAGADVHKYLLEQLNLTKGKCFYLGASESTLNKIRERLSKEYPEINLKTYSPPYKPVFTSEESARMISEVNSFCPDVLFIGMTAPKQEKWSNQFREQLDARIICSIGAVFDFYAGTISRPHPIWINLGLEWFARFLNEPKRMWKRYFYYGPMFVWFAMKEKTSL